MALRKIRDKKMDQTVETEPKTKPVRLDLEVEVHRMLRLVAAHEGLSMAAYARDTMERHLRGEIKERGIKT